jgi:hypothetical protein
MDTALKIKKLELQQEQVRTVGHALRSVGTSLIHQPATGLLLGFLCLKGASKAGLLSPAEQIALGAIFATSGMVGAFKNIAPTVVEILDKK